MSRTVSIAVQLLLCGLLVWGAAEGWTHRAEIAGRLGLAAAREAAPVARQADGVPVVIARVAEATDDISITAVGTGRARRSIALRPDAEGKIVAMAIEAGRRFARGAEMLRLDDTDQQLALALAEARLAEAGRVLERYEALETRAVTSTAQLSETRTAREVARIEREQAQAALDDRMLRAPFDGVAGLPEVEIGDRIDTDTVIASFDDRSEILVGFDLPEQFLARLEDGAEVSATTPARPGERFAGTIDAIDSRVDPVSRTARVRVRIDNAGDRLRPGASFTVTLRLPGLPYPAVPELALQFARESPYVWRIEGGAARRVPVALVRRGNGEVLVEGALDPGDAVVVEGVQRLREGRAVTVVGGEDALAARAPVR